MDKIVMIIDGFTSLDLRFDEIQFHHLSPIVNGKVFANNHAEELEPSRKNGKRFKFDNDEDGYTFLVDFFVSDSKKIYAVFILEGLPLNFPINSFGIRIKRIDGIRSFLRNGYHSWDGSTYVPINSEWKETSEVYQGYAMTQFIPKSNNGSIVLGFDRHDRFQHSFKFEKNRDEVQMDILVFWDQKNVTENQSIQSEKIWFIEHHEVENGLREWAKILAISSPQPPRITNESITGWCSWYNLYSSISQENILEHLDGCVKVRDYHDIDLKVFQIDDGFTPEMGDWLEIKPQFPEGMKPLLGTIKAAGFIPGLWIAPFVVGNRSHLFQNHPDWVIKDKQTGSPLIQMEFYGEFRWHKRSEEYYILDCTHPEALQYLKEVFSIWHHDWGCNYFKTDFMFFGSEYGPDRAEYYISGMTRIEIWRKVAEIIRESIGDSLWLGCGCPLWASVGLVDAVRVGRDMGVSWKGDRGAFNLLQDIANRNFGNHILWTADPDCILLRNNFHYLSENEINSLAIFSGMIGGLITTSDKLDELSPDRIKLLHDFAKKEQMICNFPLLAGKQNMDGEELDPIIVQVSHGLNNQKQNFSVFFFNSGEVVERRQYNFEQLHIPPFTRYKQGINGNVFVELEGRISVELEPHSGEWIFFEN